MKPTLGVLILIVVAGVVGTLVGRSTRPATAPRGSREAQVDAGMDRVVTSIRFDALGLHKAVDELRKAANVNLTVKWKVLEAAGIDQATPVTVTLNDVPLSQALQLVCDEAGGGTVKICAQADRGVIVISTDEDFSRETEARIYDVRDLIIADHQFMNGSASTSSPSVCFPATAPSSTPASPYLEPLDRLKQIITDTIAPDSWRDAGGTVGSIHDFDGLLIIVTTSAYHQQIADLLEKIRARGN